MADARNKFEQSNRQGLVSDEMCVMTLSEMRQVVGGGRLDGPLGDPPKPLPGDGRVRVFSGVDGSELFF